MNPSKLPNRAIWNEWLWLSRPQLTSQDHTPQVIQRALEKHNMEDVSHRDFSLCQMLISGKGRCGVHLDSAQASVLATALNASELWFYCLFKICHVPRSWFELYDDVIPKFHSLLSPWRRLCILCHYVPILESLEKFTPPAAIGTIDLPWTVFPCELSGVKWKFSCSPSLTTPLLSSLRLRAPDPWQGQRVLRHVHHRQLRLCAASALEEPQETLWLLFQPGSSTQEPLRQVRRVLDGARSSTELSRSCWGCFSSSESLPERAENTSNDHTCPNRPKSDTKRKRTQKTIQPWRISFWILFSSPTYGSTNISVNRKSNKCFHLFALHSSHSGLSGLPDRAARKGDRDPEGHSAHRPSGGAAALLASTLRPGRMSHPGWEQTWVTRRRGGQDQHVLLSQLLPTNLGQMGNLSAFCDTVHWF